MNHYNQNSHDQESAQKHGLLHEFSEVNKETESFKSVLEAEYGQININVDTGEYTSIQTEEKLEVVKEEPANVE